MHTVLILLLLLLCRADWPTVRFTGVYKKRFEINRNAGILANDRGSGDLCVNPIRAIRNTINKMIKILTSEFSLLYACAFYSFYSFAVSTNDTTAVLDGRTDGRRAAEQHLGERA